jgi:hypothetical protein
MHHRAVSQKASTLIQMKKKNKKKLTLPRRRIPLPYIVSNPQTLYHHNLRIA